MKRSFWPHGKAGTKRHNARGRALLGAAIALGGVALAACGSIQASGSGAGSGRASPAASGGSSGSAANAGGGAVSSQPALCRDAATVTSVEVVRSHGFRLPEPQTAFPNQVTVTSPPRVRAVARALCALPPMPRGVLNCPAQIAGADYTLRFAADGRSLPAVTIEATGCQTVTGVGPVRWAATSPGLWRVLAEAVGRTPPGPPALSGDRPGSTCRPRITKIDGCPGLARPGGAVAEPAGAAAP